MACLIQAVHICLYTNSKYHARSMLHKIIQTVFCASPYYVAIMLNVISIIMKISLVMDTVIASLWDVARREGPELGSV